MDQHNQNFQAERLNRIPVPVSVRICGRSLTLDQFLNWAPGTVLSFDQSATSPLEICVGSQTIGEGHAVKVGGKIGLRLHHVGTSPQLNATTTETR